MKIDTATIKKFREQTGAGIMDAKKALQEAGGDLAKAADYLKKHSRSQMLHHPAEAFSLFHQYPQQSFL